MELQARETRLKLTIIPFSLTLQDCGTPYQIALLPVHQFSLLKLVSGCICLLNIAPNFLLFLYTFVFTIVLLGCSYLVFLIPRCLSKKKTNKNKLRARERHPVCCTLRVSKLLLRLWAIHRLSLELRKFERLVFFFLYLLGKYFIRFCCCSNSKQLYGQYYLSVQLSLPFLLVRECCTWSFQPHIHWFYNY